MKKERAARKERLALQVGIALTAGVFGAVPVAEGAPVVDKVVTAGTQVAQSGNVTDVTGTQANNIVKWQDFSVGKGETVRFDDGAKEKNYLNLVTGPKESEIAGKVEGGKDVYLVNPHGVIFSHGAQVDVGNLYVSTENTEAALQAFSAGKTAGEVLTAGTANADVVNLGGVAASTVIVNGDNIRFLTDDVQATQVTLQAAKNIVTEQDAARSAAPGVLRAASLSSSAPSYVLRAANTESRRAILNSAGLAEMNNNLSGSYSLEADLTLSGSYTPIGGDSGAFTGTFDGNFHTISGIQVSGGTYGGLFGLTSGATIQNVGVKDGSVTAVHAGGIVGKAVSTTLTDVYNAGVDITAIDNDTDYSGFSAGGIVGYAKNSKIGKVYNTGTVNGEGAGLIGCAESGTTLTNAYNTGAAHYAVVAYAPSSDTSNISYTYATQGLTHSEFYGGKLDTDTVFSVTSQDTKLKKYKDKNFDISDSGSDNTVWRIYEGHSLPLLRDFLRRGKGTVTVNYDYTGGINSQGTNSGSNKGADLTLIYNNQDVELSNISYINANGLTVDTDKIAKDTSLRNANVYDENGQTANGQQAFYCTSQDGYDLVGNNVYINQREVDISGDSVAGKHITKVYDGKTDASDAVKAIFNASSTSVKGLIAGDTTASLTTNDLKASFADKNVGVGKTVTANGTLTLSQTAHNYKVTGNGTAQLNNVTLYGDITPATLTLSLADGKTLTKVYEGKANAATKETVSSLLSSDKTVTGLQTDDSGKTDVVTLGFQNADAKGTYGTKNSDGTFTPNGNAGAHDVELAGIKLDGADAGNYNLIDASGNIIWGENYTAGADANASGTLTAVGKTSGGTAYLKGTITRRNLTADGFTWYDGGTLHAVADNTKEYDTTSVYKDAKGKRVNKADSSATGLVSGDSVAFTVKDSGTHFVRATVTDGKVTVSNDDAKTVNGANAIAYAVTVSGEDARNYTLNGSDIQDGGTATVYGEGKITPRTLLVGAADGKVFEKTYDGDNTLKTSDGRGTAKNPFTMADGYLVYTGDANHQLLNDGAKITYTGTYRDKDVARDANGKATTKPVTFTAQVTDQGGSASANYVFLNGSSKNTTMDFVGKGIIDPAKITAVTLDKVSKTYDSTADNTSAPLKGATGIVSGENYADILQTGTDSKYVVKNADGSYQETPHVNATNVRYTISLKNPGGKNYELALPQDADGNYLAYGEGKIDPLTIKSITLHPVHNTEITKVYDSSYAVKHEENGRTVQADSYVSTLEADIPKTTNKLTFTKGAQSLGYTVADARFADKNSHNGAKQGVTYYLDVTGPDGYNDYAFDSSLLENGKVKASYAPGGIITPKDVTPVIRRQDLTKVFDGTTDVVDARSGAKLSGDALVELSGVYASDDIKNDSTAQYQNANVNRAGEAGKAGNYPDGKDFVSYTYGLSGDTGGNYRLTQTSGTGRGTITPRHLTATFSEVQKTYDGETALVGSQADKGLPTITLNNLAENDENKDQIGVSYQGAYASPNVTDGNYVKYTGVALTNNDAGNYVLDLSYLPGEAKKTVRGEGKITSAQVTKNDITTLFDPITKIYDGNTDVAYDHTGDAVYDVDYADGTDRSRTVEDFLKDGDDDAANGMQSISIKGRKLTLGTDYTVDGASYDGVSAEGHKVTYRFKLSDMVRKNYDFSQVLGDGTVFSGNDLLLLGKTQGTITPKTVTAALSGVADIIEKTYDGNRGLPVDVTNRVTFTGLLGGDKQLGKVAGAYDTEDVVWKDGTVGTKDVLYTPTLDRTGAANYQLKLVSPEGTALTDTTLTGVGQGRIQPKALGFTAGYTEKTYDATADAKVIDPKFTGLVGGKSLTASTADGKTLVKAQYGIYDGTNFTPDENVEGKGAEPDFKAVAYTNLQQALQQASGQSDTIKASNYTIADTVYFEKAKQQGKIKRLALSAGDIKMRWSDNITKQYDGTDAVDLSDPKKNFQIYIDEATGTDGQKKKLPNTVYLQYELGTGGAKYNSKNVRDADTVTYDIRGLKNSDKLANNFKFNSGDARDLSNYQGTFTLKNGDRFRDGMIVGDGTKAAVVGITKRVLQAEVSPGNNNQVYNGSEAADKSFLVLTDGTDNKSAAAIKAMLEKDRTTFGDLVKANYIDAQGKEDANASASKIGYNGTKQGAKRVRYTVGLTDALKDNYTVDKDDVSKTETSYDGYGDIFRRVVYVGFADDQEDHKTYDGDADVKTSLRTFKLSDEIDDVNQTGIIKSDQGKVRLDAQSVKGTYESAHVKRVADDGTPASQEVRYQGFGVDNANYEVRAKAANGTDSDTLVGKGTITPAQATVSLAQKDLTKVYDGTTAAVKYRDAADNVHDLTGENVQVEAPASLVGKDHFLLNRGQGTRGVYRSANVADNGNNPVTYAFTLQNQADGQTGDGAPVYEDYDVVLKSGEKGEAHGAGGTLTTPGTITPRTVTVRADDTTKEYDGTAAVRDAGKNLVFGNIVLGDTIHALAKGVYQETSAGAGDAADATDGSERLLDHDVLYTEIDLRNSNYKLADDVTSVRGKGTISRATIALTADPVTLTAGDVLPLSYSGQALGWKTEADAAAWAADADAANYSYAALPGQLSRAGTYPIWAWYRTGTDEAGLPVLQRVERPMYGRNYYLAQAPSNQTALHILRPSNPEIPDHLDDVLNPARKFVPNRDSYNHASHDVGSDVLRAPQAGIEYAKSGINVGAGAASGKDRASMAVSGEGSVVNLTGGDAVHGAVRNLTDSSAAGFIVSGNPETFGVAPGTLTQLAQRTEGGTPSGGAAVAGGADARGSVLTGQDAHQTARVPSAEPAAAAAGVADGVQLFHEDGARDAQQPVRLAATGDVQLFGDGIPATQVAGTPAEVSLFDDEEAASARPASLTPETAAVSLFDDEESTAAAQKPSTAGTVQVTTASSDDEEEKKEKEEAAHAAALKAKGADIGIESEGAGVNLAG